MKIPPPPPLRAAVIGCGAIAYEHLPFLATSPRVELVGVCDRSPAMAHAASERFGKAPVFTDIGTLIEAARPDVVHVLTPPSSHVDIIRLLLAGGANIICEKPMTGDAQTTEMLLKEAKSAGAILTESRNLLFNDDIIELRSWIAEGRLGNVVECDILLSLNFLAGPFGDPNLAGTAIGLPGGAVHDFLPHLVYLFLALTGAKGACDVYGTLKNRSGNPRAEFDHIDALIDFGSCRGRLRVATDCAPDSFEVVVRGSKGTAQTDLYNPALLFAGPPNIGKRAPLAQISAGKRLVRAGLSNFRNKVMQHGTMHGMPRMLDAIYTAIAAKQTLPFSDAELLETARLTDQLVALGKTT
jgi:predicted dehydrogenase